MTSEINKSLLKSKTLVSENMAFFLKLGCVITYFKSLLYKQRSVIVFKF